MHELIGWHVEQWLVTQDKMQNDPRSRRTQDDGAQHRGVHVSHDFFEREEYRRYWRIEGCRQRRRSSNRDERLDPARPEAQPAPQYGRDAGAHLHGWTFAAK